MKRNGKAGEPSLKDRLNAAYLAAYQADFAMNGVAAIQELRKQKPDKYAEIGARLITQAQEIPDPNKLNSADSTRDIAKKVLQSVGLSEPDTLSIDDAVKANEVYVKRLEEIVDEAANRYAAATASESEEESAQ